ncbi:MAG TPA: LysR family transcriptional regulator [Gaiellaceae bacterium]|nr:LysR family transcriptional regulator [Gaiellaceae bacterium]
MLDVRRLRTFREVALHGTIRGASQALSFTPSAVSQQVSALERELGVELLERTGRSVHLTAAGRALVERADAILAGLAETEAEVRSIAGASPRAVRIASFASASATIVADALRGGDLDVHILDADPRLGLARLRAGEVDVAILWEYDFVPLRRPAAIELERLLDDPIDVVLPRKHAAAAAQRIDLADLADEAWINSTPLSSCHPFLARACNAAGFEPRIAAETLDHRALHHLVASGVGLALVPRLSQLDLPPSLVAQPIAPNPPKRRIHAAFRRGRQADPAVRLLLELIGTTAKGRPAGLALVHARG